MLFLKIIYVDIVSCHLTQHFSVSGKKLKKRSIPHVQGNSVDLKYISRENIFATPPFNFFRITFLSYLHVFLFLQCIKKYIIINDNLFSYIFGAKESNKSVILKI